MRSSDAASSSGTVPSLLTAGISDDDAQARATSSITIAVAMRVAARAAVGLGDMHRVQVGLDQGIVGFLRELGILVDLGGVRGDLLVGQGADRLAQRVVLGREGEGGKIEAHDLDS